MSFDIKGFLDDNIENKLSNEREQYKKLFDFANDVNKLAVNLVYKINAHDNNLQELLNISIYIQILQFFESTLILSKRGALSSASSILRDMFEPLCKIILIKKDINFANNYVYLDCINQKKMLENLKKNNEIDDVFYNTINNNIDKFIFENNIDYKKLRKSEPSVKEMATNSGLLNHYNTVYSHLCEETHTSVKALNKYVGTDINDKIISINFKPYFNGIDGILTMAIYYMLKTMENICDQFSIKEDKLNDYFNLLNSLDKIYP